MSMCICMHVCSYVYMHVCRLAWMSEHVCISIYNYNVSCWYVCSYVCMYVCLRKYMYVCMYVYMHKCMPMQWHALLYMQLYIFYSKSSFVHVWKFVCMYLCMHISKLLWDLPLESFLKSLYLVFNKLCKSQQQFHSGLLSAGTFWNGVHIPFLHQ